MFNKIEYQKKYREENKNKIKKQRKQYYKMNKEKIKIQNKIYREKNKDKIYKKTNEWKGNNPEKIKKNTKEYYQKNKEKIKKWKEDNKERVKLINKKSNIKNKNKKIQWAKNNKDKIILKIKKYNNKIKNTPELKIRYLLSHRIKQALKNQNYIKSKKTLNLLGCSLQEFKNWLGIISNYDGKKIHIDHIIPCSLYDLTDENEQKKCFNFRNHRLISAKKNLSKNNKLDIELIKCYEIEDLLPDNYFVNKK